MEFISFKNIVYWYGVEFVYFVEVIDVVIFRYEKKN